MTDPAAGRRSEYRTTVELYFNIQVQTDRYTRVHEFKVLDVSSKGMRILVDKDSDALKYMEVGEIIGTKLIGPGQPEPPALMKCQVRHVTPITEGDDKGAVIVGFVIL